MDSFLQLFVAVFAAFLIAFRAHRKKSLSTSGAVAGFFVVALHIFVGYRFGAMLLAFFYSSSSLTKMGEDRKRVLDADFKEGGQRNWLQVLANSGIASVLVVAIWVLTEGQDKCLNSQDSPLITSLIGAVIGHYSCCNGDTWSSELGILSDEQPRLITTFKSVKKGTNGGVTKTGILAAAAAGSVIGLSFVLLGLTTTRCESNITLKQLLVIPIATLAGLCGSVIDSLLGATLQFSGFCTIRRKVVGKPGPTVRRISGANILDNNAVNFVSILLTAFLAAIACLYLF
ncbi:Transmembrane protein 19 [Spatholobus suberectus]|nr:Transmembrane protein 19 [Spatholobus suberectus]